MKLLKTIVLLVLAILIGGYTPSFSQSPEQIYQRGLMKVEGEGALLAAIDLYDQIADNSSADKSLQAKALLHIGMCYEKLGNQEAVKAYQRLVSNFPGQKAEVTIARERLSRLRPTEVNVSNTPLTPTPLIPKFTKIKMPANPGNGLLSPDGKRSAFISEGNVWVMPVSGEVGPYIAGEPQKLTDNIGAWDMNGSYTWSGDGKWIAFNAEVDMKSYSTSIYIVPSKGGIPQKIQVPEHRCGYPDEFRLSLSPDGKLLAYATGENSGDDESKLIRIYTIPVNGDNPKELTGPWTQEPSFSPDGSKIAYVKNYKNDDGKRFSEVWVIPFEGGTPIQVSNLQSGHVGGPVWSADGKMIAFHRRPKGENPKEIWIVPVSEDGSPTKTPKKIELPLEAFHEVAGWTPDNKIGLLLMNPQYEVIYTVPSNGGIATQVTPQGWTSYPKWSPDGEKIFFRWADGKIASVPSLGGAVDSIPIKSEFGIFTTVPGSGNDISPDGRTIVFSGTKNYFEDGKEIREVDIFTIPVEGGEPKQLTTSGQLQDRFPCWSPDGNSIAFIRPQIKDNKPIFHIYIVTKEGEDLRKITDESHKVAWAPVDWANHGKSITYFSDDKTIKSISVDSKESHVITEINNVNSQFDLSWSPGGSELAYTDKGKIWILSTESGTTKEVKTEVEAMATKLSWSPDGAKIAFTAYAGGDHELWLMENFLPLDKLVQIKAAEASPKVLTNKKIWDDPDTDLEGAPSPDGRYLSYVDWDTGDLAIYEIATGKKRRLTNKGTWDESDEFAEFSRWSPDSKQLVYDWFNKDDFIEIRIVELEDSRTRVLYKNKDVKWAQTYDWSPDGNYILACFTREKTNGQIVLISVADGSERILKTFDLKWPHSMNFSPDGGYIVYDLPKNKDSEDRDIFLMSIDGENEIPLVEHPAIDQVLGWAPDGKNILFVSDRTGSPDIWAIKVASGKPIGIPKLIRSNKGPFSPTGLGFTIDGSFYYGSTPNRTDVYTAEINPLTGKIVVPPHEFINHFTESNATPDYSYDGKYLAYVSRRPLGTMRFTTNPVGNVLCIRSLETGEENVLRPEINVFGWPRWSPDGLSVMVVNWNLSGNMGYYQINTQTGKTTPIILTEGRHLFGGHYLSPDGSTLFYGLRDNETKKYQILTRDLESGEEKVVYQSDSDDPLIISLSPDGKWLALLSGKNKCLNIVPSAGGESWDLFRYKEEEGIQFDASNVAMTWSRDGKFILFAMKNSEIENSKWELCRISVNGGKIEKLGLKMEGGFVNLSAHPDGKRFTFSARGKSNSEVWVMENFLPREKFSQNEETVNKQK